MDISYRKATDKDVSTILSLETSVSSMTYHSMATIDEIINDYLKKGQTFLILINGKQPIGMISYEPKGNSHIYINGLIVLPKYQGQGIASKALEFILDRLKEIKKVDIVTHPKNTPALKLYLKYGFEIESWKDNYYGDGEPRIVLSRIKG